jgi:hypothetical protein
VDVRLNTSLAYRSEVHNCRRTISWRLVLDGRFGKDYGMRRLARSVRRRGVSVQEQVVRFPGLEDLDEDELRKAVPPENLKIKRQEPEGRPGTSYEPFTTVAIVLLTASALQGIAAWLLKKRHRKRVELEAEIRRPDGSFEHITAIFDFSESSSEPEVVRAVGEQFRVDPAVVTEALQAYTG